MRPRFSPLEARFREEYIGPKIDLNYQVNIVSFTGLEMTGH